MGLLTSILARFGQRRERKRITRQFLEQGFTAVECPAIGELLPPLRFPEIVDESSVCLFAKEDMQMLVVPARFLPRSRLPHVGRTFVLLCTALEESPLTQGVSAAFRDPAEQYSIVDQLMMESYPAISPLPYATVFATDQRSAMALLQVVGISKKQSGSIVLHGGRLLAQVAV